MLTYLTTLKLVAHRARPEAGSASTREPSAAEGEGWPATAAGRQALAWIDPCARAVWAAHARVLRLVLGELDRGRGLRAHEPRADPGVLARAALVGGARAPAHRRAAAGRASTSCGCASGSTSASASWACRSSLLVWLVDRRAALVFLMPLLTVLLVTMGLERMAGGVLLLVDGHVPHRSRAQRKLPSWVAWTASARRLWSA